MKKNKYRPTAYRLSDWGSCTEIIYVCANCGTSFGFFGKDEKFCHKCGLEQDWSNRPSHCSEEFAKKYRDTEDFMTRLKLMDEEFNIK